VDSFEVQWSCDVSVILVLGGCKRRRAHCRVKARARARPEHGGARPRTENARSVGCALTGLARRAATNADAIAETKTGKRNADGILILDVPRPPGGVRVLNGVTTECD